MIVGATFTGIDMAEGLQAATIAIISRTPVELLWQAVPAFPARSEIWLKLLEHREAVLSGEHAATERPGADHTPSDPQGRRMFKRSNRGSAARRALRPPALAGHGRDRAGSICRNSSSSDQPFMSSSRNHRVDIRGRPDVVADAGTASRVRAGLGGRPGGGRRYCRAGSLTLFGMDARHLPPGKRPSAIAAGPGQPLEAQPE